MFWLRNKKIIFSYALLSRGLFGTVNVLKFRTLFSLCSLFSNKILIVKAEVHQMLVRIANKEDPDQTAFSEAV